MLAATVILLLLSNSCSGISEPEADLELDDSEEEILVRHKRNTGTPSNNKVNVTFEKIGPFENSTVVGLGDKIDFRITTWWPPLTAPLQVKIEMPHIGNVSSMFLCVPTISHIGSNIKVDQNLWHEKMTLGWGKNDMYEYNEANLLLTNVTQSNASVAMTNGLNDLVVSFSALVVNKTAVRANNQAVMTGIGVGSTAVFVGTARFNYSDKVVEDWGKPSMSLKGPSEVAVEHYGLFVGALYLPKLSSSLKIVALAAVGDAKAPLSICELRFAQQQGASYQCQPRPIKSVIQSGKKVYDQTHVLVKNGSVPIVVNAIRTSDNTTVEQDTLAIEVYVYFSNSSTIGTLYPISLSVQVDNDVPLVKIATAKATAAASHKPLLNVSSISPTFKSESGRQDIRPHDFATFVINMTTAAGSEDRIRAEIFLPFNTSAPFKFYRARTVFAGRNYGCHFPNTPKTELKTMGSSTTPSYVVLDFGYVVNFGFEDITEANTLSFEFVFENGDGSAHSNGTAVTVGVGVSHSRGAWVGHFQYTLVTSGASIFQMPGIKLQQKSQVKIFYPYSQQVLWMDIHTKTNSMIDMFELKMNTPIDNYIALLSFCHAQVLYAGVNVVGSERLEFESSGQRVWQNHDQLSVTLKRPLVNVGRRNVTGKDGEDDLLRLSFVITSHILDVKNKSVLHDNKLSVKAIANLTSTVVWAGVSLWSYSLTNPTGVVSFTPSWLSTKAGCGRTVQFSAKSISAIGARKFFTLQMTYAAGFQRFCGTRVKSRGSNVFCPAGSEESVEAKIPNPQAYRQRTFTNVGVDGETYTEADNTQVFVSYGQFACPSSNGVVPVNVKTTRTTSGTFLEHSSKKDFSYDASMSLETGTTPLEVDFALRNSSFVEQQFGAVAAYDLYLPINDRAFLNLSFASATTGVLICEVVVASAGDNLPCAADHLCTKKYEVFKSDAWTNVSLDLKIIENIGSSGMTKAEANKLAIEVMFFPLEGTTSASLTSIVQFGKRVVTKSLSVSPGSPKSVNRLSSPATLYRPSDRNLRIFEYAVFTINITHAEGLSDINITVKAETALSFNFSMEILEWGDNFCCRNKSLTSEKAFPTTGNYTDKDNLEWILHLCNTGLTTRRSWRRTYNFDDDRIVLGLRAATTDLSSNTNETALNFTVTIDGTEYNETVTVITSAADRPELNMEVENLRTSGLACSHNITLRLKVNLYFGANSRASAVNVKGVIVLPFYLKLTNISEATPINPTLITGAGVSKPFVFSYATPFHNTTMNVSFVAEFAMDFASAMLVSRASTDLKLHYSLTYSRLAKGSERSAANYRFPDAALTVQCSTIWPLPSLGLGSGRFPTDRLWSSCGNADSVRPGKTGWGCGSQPGAFIELCLRNRTRISALRFFMGTVSSFRIRYFYNAWISDGVIYNVTYDSTKQALVPLVKLTARRLRILPLSGNAPNPKVYKFTMEVYGEELTGTDPNPVTCEDANVKRHTDYVPRQYLYSPKAQTLYICMEPEAGVAARCLATYDKGTHWFKVDEEVANVVFASSSETFLYGINRNLITPMLSEDGGYTWSVLDDATYNIQKASSSMVRGKDIPYEDWSVGSPESLASSYGLTYDGNQFSVSNDGVHTKISGKWKIISKWT